jgi:hypothetical protein
MDSNLDNQDENIESNQNKQTKNIDLDRDEQVTNSTTSSPEHHKRPKRILLLILAFILIPTTGASVYLINSNSQANSPPSNVQTRQEEVQDKSNVENETTIVNKLEIQPFDSLYFVIPDGWLTEQIVNGNGPTETILFSPDTEPSFNDYVSIKNGISIKISEFDIDTDFDPVASFTADDYYGHADEPRIFNNHNGIEFSSIQMVTKAVFGCVF